MATMIFTTAAVVTGSQRQGDPVRLKVACEALTASVLMEISQGEAGQTSFNVALQYVSIFMSFLSSFRATDHGVPLYLKLTWS